MTILRWGLLSTARINRALIPPLKSSPRNQVTTVASRDLAKAEAYAQEWGIPRALGSYEALLADPEIDVIYIPLPNQLHAEWAIRALEAGKHVLCEKPLAIHLAEVDAMAAAAHKAGRVLMEAFMYRHHPQTLKVQALVREGAIGRLQALKGAFSFSLTRDGDVRLAADLGGGSLWDVGCYPVSYMRAVAGVEPVEVFAQQWIGRGGVDEAFFGQLRFPDGVFGQFDSAFRSPYRTHMEIVGSEGVLVVPKPFAIRDGSHIVLRRGDEEETIAFPAQDLYLGQVENMADAILNGTPTRLPVADSRHNVATLLALYQSAASGQPVTV